MNEHGTLRSYIVDGCRCDTCRTYRVRWQKQYLHDRANGRPRTVPASVVQDHLTMLRDAGMSWWAITRAAGYASRNAVQNLMRPDKKRVNNSTAARILAVTPDSDPRLTAPRPVGPTRDRLRALAVMGWDCRALADHLDLTHDQLDAWRSGKRSWVMARSEATVTALFDKLWDTRGPSKRTATWARKQGWPAPLDLEEIDQSAAADPNYCATCSEIFFLRECGESEQVIATRLGFNHHHYITDHLRRHQRESA